MQNLDQYMADLNNVPHVMNPMYSFTLKEKKESSACFKEVVRYNVVSRLITKTFIRDILSGYLVIKYFKLLKKLIIKNKNFITISFYK